jgi:hypothetical protein
MQKLKNKSLRANQRGDLALVVIAALVIAGLFCLLFLSGQPSSERVSGIVYNTKNDGLINGTTTFSVRASESTYVSQENQSSYCLPEGSEYIDLVNRAAEDKTIKVVVTTDKYFAVQAPWTCHDNVTVTEVPAKTTKATE